MVCEDITVLSETIKKQFTTVTIFSKLLAGIIFILLPFIGFFLGIRYQKSKDFLLISQSIKQVNNSTEGLMGGSSPSLPLPEGTTQTYTSQKLKISFNYFEPSNLSWDIKVKEMGDKVFIYAIFPKSGTDQTSSEKYVQLFDKDPSLSLEEAVREKVLTGYSLENCPISKENNPTNPNYDYVHISIPTPNPNESYTDLRKKADLCPTNYINFNQVTYFVMDKSHPNRFAFFSLGQDNFSGGVPVARSSEVTWDKTLKFTD